MHRDDVTAWLSKTDFLTGLQCELALWLRKHAPDEAAPPEAAQRIRFRDGNLVDAHAHDAYPGGTNIDEPGFSACAQATQWAIAEGAQRIYQATFSADWGGCMVDVLDREDDGTWTLREVKSTTSAKDIHVRDAAFQAMVLLDLGYALGRTLVVHIDPKASAPEPHGFLREVDVSADVNTYLETLPDAVDEQRRVVDGPEPDVPIGLHCEVPYECPFKPRCWSGVPRASVFTIPDMDAGRLRPLLDAGILALEDIPRSKRLPRAARDYVEAHRAGPHLHPKRLSAWVSSLLYPLRFIYFVTERPPLPALYGMRPYEPVPVMVACRTLYADGRVDRTSALHTAHGSPLKFIAKALVEAVGERGYVVTYDAPLARDVISVLKGSAPEHSRSLARLRDRLRDLREVLEGSLRAPGLLGSYEMCDVARTLVGPETEVPTEGEVRLTYLNILDAEEAEYRIQHGRRLQTQASAVADGLLSVHEWVVEAAERYGSLDGSWVAFRESGPDE